jgi:hypothetical protein
MTTMKPSSVIRKRAAPKRKPSLCIVSFWIVRWNSLPLLTGRPQATTNLQPLYHILPLLSNAATVPVGLPVRVGTRSAGGDDG